MDGSDLAATRRHGERVGWLALTANALAIYRYVPTGRDGCILVGFLMSIYRHFQIRPGKKYRKKKSPTMKVIRNFFLPLTLLAALLSAGLPASAQQATSDVAPVRTKAERDALTPEQVFERFRSGNERFVAGRMTNRDLLMEKRQTSAGQFPSAVLLSCMDSRAPAEFIFDKGIGEIFNARVAGNVLNPDMTGSLEYACAVAGAKLIVILGHTECGAIKGAIDEVEMGSLTGLLERIHPAIVAAKEDASGESSSDQRTLGEAVTDRNVELTIEKLRRTSPILRELEKKGDLKIVGGIYDLATGRVRFLDVPSDS